MWTADEALRVAADLNRWLRTGDAGRDAQKVIIEQLPQGVRSQLEEQVRPRVPGGVGQWMQTVLADQLAERDVFWCDPSMVNLLSAAAADFPGPDRLAPHDLIDPDAGLIVFAQPLPLEWAGLAANGGYHQDVSAVTWATPFENEVIFRAWMRSPAAVVDAAGQRLKVGELTPLALTETPGVGSGAHHALLPIGRLVVAFTSLTRASRVVETETVAGSKKARASARRQGLRGEGICRVYLNRPEVGDRELEQLRADRQQIRGHWVRGHWRNQWYASVEEHRWVWVEGFPRGNFDARATDQHQRVQIAKG